MCHIKTIAINEMLPKEIIGEYLNACKPMTNASSIIEIDGYSSEKGDIGIYYGKRPVSLVYWKYQSYTVDLDPNRQYSGKIKIYKF